jgi:hypothetical protein
MPRALKLRKANAGRVSPAWELLPEDPREEAVPPEKRRSATNAANVTLPKVVLMGKLLLVVK